MISSAVNRQIAQIHGTVMQPERSYVALAADALDRFIGRAARAVPGVPVRELRPVSERRFFDKLGSEYVSESGPDGQVTGFQLRFPGGRESRLRPIE